MTPKPIYTASAAPAERAGRDSAILFVAPRERRMLHVIEKAARQKIEPLKLPTTEVVNNKRIADFKQRITDTLAKGELAFTRGLLEQYQQEHDVPALDIAAALANLTIGERPLLLTPGKVSEDGSRDQTERSGRRDRGERPEPRGRARREPGKDGGKRSRRRLPDADMERFRIEVGAAHGVKPGNIVGAIANEAGLDGQHIGPIEINDRYTLVDLPKGMPKEVFNDLKKAWVCGQRLSISRAGSSQTGEGPPPDRRAKPKPKKSGPDSSNRAQARKARKERKKSEKAGASRASSPGKLTSGAVKGRGKASPRPPMTRRKP